MVDLNAKIDAQKRLIETLRSEGVDEMNTREESLRLEIDNLEKTITEWQAKAVDVGQRMADYNRIKDKVDRAQEAYRQQSTNLTNIDLNKNVDQDKVSVLEPATDPVSVRPGLWRTMGLAAGSGLLLGLAVLAVLAHFDDRILVTTDLEAALKEQLLAQIPRVGDAAAGMDALSPIIERRWAARLRGIAALAALLAPLPAGGRGRAAVVTDYQRRAGRGEIDGRGEPCGDLCIRGGDGAADRRGLAAGAIARAIRDRERARVRGHPGGRTAGKMAGGREADADAGAEPADRAGA